MNKKNITILVSVIVVAVVTILLLLFNLKNYDVMFNTTGGSFVETQKVKVFNRATRPLDPTKDGYTFDNWYYNDGIFDFDTVITQDIILEARWIEGSPVAGTYVVSFNSNGGSSVASKRTDTNGIVEQPENPTREGYRFVSWQYRGEDFDFATKITSNITLIAKWEEGSEEPSVPAETVAVSPRILSLSVGSTRRINVILTPSNATNRTMKWTTSNNVVATVDASGLVRAVGPGTAVITVEVDGKKASLTVTVVKATTPTNPSNPTNPSEPTTPTEPETPPVEEKETYSVEYEAIPASAMGEVYIKIRSSKRGFIGGTIEITTQDGTVVPQTITAAGYKMPKSVIASVKIMSTN